MYNLYEGRYIGYHSDLSYEEFSGSDDKKLFNDNLKTMPDDWYYRNVKITYKRNSWGHRCKEFADLDKSNYILTVGCSLTEGIGLELEKTYTHVLAEKLGCDYYNMGLGGCGIDIVKHNLTMWLATIKSKPKLIIMQWPYWGRFSHFDSQPTGVDISKNILRPESAHSPNMQVTRMLDCGESINYFETVETLVKIQIDALVMHTYNIPMIHAGLPYGNRIPQKFEHKFVNMKRIDYARDNHFGIESNKLTASNLYHVALKNFNT